MKCVSTIFFIFLLIQMDATDCLGQSTLDRFWSSVQYRYINRIQPLGVRSYLFEESSKLGGTHTDKYARLESLGRNTPLQKQILLDLYISCSHSKEYLRELLYAMCGSYELVNPVSDYVVSNYKHNPIAIRAIKNIDSINMQKQRNQLMKDSLEQQLIIAKINEKLLREQQNKRDDSISKIAEIFGDLYSTPLITVTSRDFDIPPKFKNGEWCRYCNKNIPMNVRRQFNNSKVIVSFTILRDGTIENPAIEVGKDTACFEHAIKLVNTTNGKWKAAQKGKQPIDYRILLPIIFLN